MVENVVSMMPRPRTAAFFDLDKTIIARSSTLALGRPLYDSGLIRRGDVLRSAYAQLMFAHRGADEAQMERMRLYLQRLCAGWDVSKVRAIIDEALERLITPIVYAEATALIAEHREAGREVVIVSSSGEELVRPIASMLGIGRVIATQMEVADGRYTGRIGNYVYGPAKAQAITELAAAEGYRLSECFAYSDSITDLPMLSAVGHPVAVNPDRALRRAAAEQGWPVRSFRLEVPVGSRDQTPRLVLASAAAGVSAAAVTYAVWQRRRAAS